MLGVSQSRGLKLFGREIIFEEFQRMWSRYLNVTDRRTDRQTDRRLTVASPHSALASRGNKQNAYKIAVRTHTCVTALNRHSRCTVRCSQRQLYIGTNTRYASIHTNSGRLQVSNAHGIISHRHRLFHLNFGGVPVAPDRHVGVSVSRCLKLQESCAIAKTTARCTLYIGYSTIILFTPTFTTLCEFDSERI